MKRARFWVLLVIISALIAIAKFALECGANAMWR